MGVVIEKVKKNLLITKTGAYFIRYWQVGILLFEFKLKQLKEHIVLMSSSLFFILILN